MERGWRIFLNDTRLATLYSPPYVQPLRLGHRDGINFLRAVAFLEDGNSTEDLVFLNAPGFVEEAEVRMVGALHHRPQCRWPTPERSDPATTSGCLRNGVAQEILRFERLDDLPDPRHPF